MVDFYGILLPIVVFLVVPLALGIVIALSIPYGTFDPLFIFYAPLALAYGTNPHKSTKGWEKEFREKGYESIIHEFQTCKILFVVLILLLSISTLSLVNSLGNIASFHDDEDDDDDRLTILQDFVFRLTIFYIYLLFSTIGAGLRILTRITHKDFRFYIARGYCITATKKEDEFEKSRYLHSVLDSYNKYLRRHTQIQIKDLSRIHATFLVADSEEKNQMIKSICDSLEGDRLRLARYLSSVYKVPEAEFFVGESLVQKLKTVGTVLAATIPIVISIITLILSPEGEKFLRSLS